MKPKNRVMCADCGRMKMLFDSESSANGFIRWNADAVDTHGSELRAYYCPACCGWHITHHEHTERYDTQTADLIAAYHRDKPTKYATKMELASRWELSQLDLLRIAGIERVANKKSIKKWVDGYTDDANMRSRLLNMAASIRFSINNERYDWRIEYVKQSI